MTVHGLAGEHVTWTFRSRNPKTGHFKPEEAYDTFGADNVVRRIRRGKGDGPG
jgi:hypothetical protein